jgi:phosphate transport system substrate-binding protein
VTKNIIAVLLGVAVTLTGFTASAQEAELNKPKKAEETITWAGCGITKKAFMHKCAEIYQKTTGVRIELKGGGATIGIRKATAGSVDLGGSCRICKPELTNEEKSARMTHIAWDALVLIVHPENPVKNISIAQARKIFTGKIRNWKEVTGGKNSPINLIIRRGKMSGVGYMGRRLLFNDTKMTYFKRALVVRSSGPLERKIEKSVSAFALTGFSSASKRKVKVLRIDGVAATKENIASGKYALFRPLFLVTGSKPNSKTQDFLKWILSDVGQKVISEENTVNLLEGRLLQEKYKYWENTDRIVNFVKAVKTKDPKKTPQTKEKKAP